MEKKIKEIHLTNLVSGREYTLNLSDDRKVIAISVESMLLTIHRSDWNKIKCRIDGVFYAHRPQKDPCDIF